MQSILQSLAYEVWTWESNWKWSGREGKSLIIIIIIIIIKNNSYH